MVIRQPTGDPYKWKVLALFWLVYFLNHADRQILFSVFPLLQKDLGLTNTQLGLLGSSFQWVYAVLVPVAGFLGDSVNRKKLIVAALTIWSATTFSSGMASGFVMLLMLRALTGAGEAFYYPAATSIISDYHGQRTRAFAMSIHQTSLYFGIVTSGTLAGLIGQRYGWRLAFFVFGGLGLAAALLVGRLLREPRRGQVEEAEQVKAAAPGPLVPQTGPGLQARISESFHTPTAIVLMLAFIGMSFASVAVITWMPTLLHGKFEYGLASASFHATFYHQFGAFLGVLTGGRLADRWAARSRVSRPLVQGVGLVLAAPFIYWLGQSGSSTSVFLALGLFGVFRGMYDSNLFASLYEVITPGARATATGLMLSAGFLVGGSSPVVIGKLSQTMGLGPALAATAVCYLAAGLIVFLDCALWFRRDIQRIESLVVRRAEQAIAATR